MSQPAEGLDAPIDASEHGPTARREPAGRLIGRTVDGRYRITDFIGSGGMGELYVAEHLRLGRQFAVKVLRSELARDRRFVERFEREARTVASLASEHIVGIVDSGSLEEGEPYFVMELLQGEDLRHLLTRMAPLPASRVANLGIDACRGLHVAHSAGLVHRDLKPENLFVTRGDDGRDVVKLLDFGVVKVLAADTATTPGTLVGTARYMAPEQAGTDSPLTATSDVFSLGVILYECLSGSCPFDGETLERVLFKVMNHEPEPLDRLRPEIPLSLARAVQRAIAKDPGKRHRSARAFEEALLAAAGARTPHPPERHTLAESDRTLVDLLGPEPAESVVVERASSSPSRRTAIAAAVVGLGVGALALAQRGVGNPVARPEASAPAPTASAPVVAPGVQPALESARATVKPTEVAPLAAASAEAPVAASAPIEKPTRGLAGGARKLPSPSASAQKSAKDKAQTKPNTQPFVSYDPENPYAGDDTTAR